MRKFCLILALALALCGMAAATAETPVITLSDGGIMTNTPGARAAGSVLTITAPGEYVITGGMSQGQIVVSSEMEGKITLIFDGVTLHNEQGPAVYVKKCKPRLSIQLAEGSANTLTGGEFFIFEDDDEPNGVIFSKADMTITGTGALNVTSKCMDGIVSKDDLRIKGGVINVTAPRNGIRGKDGVEIYDGTITVVAGNDGIKSTNKDDADRGYVDITGGTITIICGDEPISAITRVSLTGGTLNATITGVAD